MVESSGKDPKKTTPPKFDSYKDARKYEGAGKYPNYWAKKTRSGHAFMMDDSEGAESITVQHRSGSMWQFMPDGAVLMTAHNGQQQIIFGENRILVTGAQDIVVQGGGSLSVDGDYNMTVKGNHNTTVHGDINVVGKNLNQTITGAVDTSAKSMTTKIEGSTSFTTHGVTTIASDGGVAMTSTGDKVAIAGASGVSMKGGSGGVFSESKGDMHLKISGKMVLEADGDTIIKGKTVYVDGSPNVKLNDGNGERAEAAKATFQKPTQPRDV